MTYSYQGLIQASDYNTRATTVNATWVTLYGQTPPLGTVASGTTVAATPWDAIIGAIADSAAHQGTTITAITPPAQYDLIQFYDELDNNIISIGNGAYNLAAAGTDITDTATRTTPWGIDNSIPSVSSTVTVTFGSAAEFGYFLNCGGTVLVNCSRSGGDDTPDDLTWTALCTAVGTVGIPALNTAQTIAGAAYDGLTKFGGSGTPDIYTREGVAQLNGTPQLLFRQLSGEGVYSSNAVDLSYSVTATELIITVTFVDGSAGGSVTGDLSVTGIARPPATTYIANTWGTPVVSVTEPA